MTRARRLRDPLAEMLRRLVGVGAEGETIYYSNLINGIAFDGSWSSTGRPFTVDAGRWKMRYLPLVCVALNRLADPILDEHGFLISALVVNKRTNEPGNGFFRAIEPATGPLAKKADRDAVWEFHLAAAYAYCEQLTCRRAVRKDTDARELSEPNRDDLFSGGDE